MAETALRRAMLPKIAAVFVLAVFSLTGVSAAEEKAAPSSGTPAAGAAPAAEGKTAGKTEEKAKAAEGKTEEKTAEKAGGKVTSFTGKGVDDAPFDLADYLGKVPILLDFGSIYCSSCVQSIPHLIVLQNDYGPKLKVVGVNLDTYGLSRVKRFFLSFKENLNFPILVDSGLQVSQQFEVSSLPTYILIDKDGKIVSRIVGYDEELRQKMDHLVKKVVGGEALTTAEEKFEQDVVVLAPDSFTKTYQRDMGVVGLTGNLPGPFTVRLNGGSERQAAAKGGMFHTRTPLSLGSNFIEVRYPKGDGMGTMAVVLFREPKMGEGLQVAFPEYKFHLPQKEERCVKCHKMDPTGLDASVQSMTDFCAVCHGYQVTEKFVHGPVPVGGCAACHDFKSKPHRYELTGQGTALCFTCHADIQDKFERPYVHGPVAMGLCTVCHSPHSSPYKFQLLQPQSSLCLSCHEDMRAKLAKFNLHKPITQEQCTGCHDPHSSDNENYFLKGKGAELCYLCHDKERMANHTHATEGPPPRVVNGMKLDAKGNMNCLTCHEPHGSDESRLFTVKGGCDGCHTM